MPSSPADATRPCRGRQRWRWRSWRPGAAALALVLALVLAAPAGARPAPDSFADLADRLVPAVVNISTTQRVEGNAGIEPPVLPPGSPFEDFFKDFMEKNQPRQSRKATSLGSGFIVDPKGYVVTNNHVIQDAEEISVILHDETRLAAKVVGRDSKTDIAVLKVDAKQPLPAVSFGNSDAVRVGDWIIAIGNPFGFGGTVTAGIISARGRDINAGPYDDFLQTDAPINRGNSGGPMFDLGGGVIGINTAIYSPSGGSIGIGFAIPSSSAEPVIRQLIEHGEVRRGWIGVRIQTVSNDIAELLGLKDTTGALVADVIAGGPAAAAKLRDGDVILEFDGKTINQMRRLPRLVADTPIGKQVPIRIWRDGREMKLTIEVAALKEDAGKLAGGGPQQPEKPQPVENIEALGFGVAAIDAHSRERFDLGEDVKGVVVVSVDPDGLAAEQGMRAGEVIVEVGQEEVVSPGQLSQRIEAARQAGKKSVLLLVEGASGLRFVAIRLSKG
jgi:serine protease Do